MSPILLTVIGALIYFIIEFKAGTVSGFQLGYWIKDNWVNIALIILCDLAWFQVAGEPTKLTALILGLIPNYTVDRIYDLIAKYKTPKGV